MRTEVKIAAVIVIVLIGVGTVWYVGWGRTASQKGPEQIGQAAPGATEDENRTFLAEETPDETASADAGTSSDDSTGSTSSSDDTGGPGTARVGMAGTTDSSSSDLASAAVASDTSGTDTTGTEPAARPARPWWEDRDRFPARVAPSDETASSSFSSTGAAEAATGGATGSTATTPPGRYLVKDGDSYWSIAKNLYGDATLCKLLIEANPKIPPMSLRPGMTISAPPKPAATAETAGSTPAKEPKAKHGTTVVDAASGTRHYIVKRGDNGFWGISEAVFGTGDHMGAIQKLNPKLNPKALQPGQRVLVPTEAPALARRTSPTASGTAGTAPRRTTPRATAGAVTGAPARAVLPSGEVFD